MSSVKMISLMLVFLLGGLRTEAMSVTGVLGKEVTIKCSHSNAFSNIKYFCKGSCVNEDVLIRSSTNKKDSNGRYSIKDEGNTFNVTISGLTEDDPGTYWCGIDRVGLDTYTEVVLTVIAGNTKDPDLSESNSNASSKKLVYIAVSLGVMLLALVMGLLIFFRHRNRDIQASSGKDCDTVCTTQFSQKQEGHQITRRDPSDNIYSNVSVSSESQIQADDLFYSTVSFNKHTDGGAAVTENVLSAELTYSTVKHKAADKPTGYYNVVTQL